MSGVEGLGRELQTTLEKGMKCDRWGQRLEAAREYGRFVAEYRSGSVALVCSEEAERRMEEVLRHVGHRAKQLVSTDLSVSANDVSLEEVKADAAVLAELLSEFQTRLSKRHSSVVAEVGEALLLPSPTRLSGQTYLSLRIERLGAKDADSYVDPFISVSVRDPVGTALSAVQHTPPSYHIQGLHLVFDLNVHVPTPLEELSAAGPSFAVFLELKHYKEKEDKVSVRCFAFLEPHELTHGAKVLELYKKPVDYARKKLYLFTEKPLYLHLHLTLHRA